ncbi:class I SAM-dependent methyltransferase [Leeia aquatica]|uniref:Ribosomal RNA small subunit methyltransferase J n=1 Tax=Leeia aquatica TaxID=2725557 RepID=A0A847SFQ4_9NEIS|nr:class I SAM-dependent methyltransferase [Leeia aquatica]NLR74782.1 class I SAM-dependent methyltransferase [Leeia aquatica]
MNHDVNASLPLEAASEQLSAADLLAERYGFVCRPRRDEAHSLWLDAQGLALLSHGPQAPGPLRVDFVAGAAAHRRKFGGGRGQAVAKAIGLKGTQTCRVLDATAGLGGDAFVLASLGCEVQMFERVAVVAALLEDGLLRAAEDPEVGDIVARMQLQYGDALQLLREQPDAAFDVVFLDPMFPEKRGTARARKGMQVFQQLLSGDPDADGLLLEACRVARRRVVVKRPKGAPWLADRAPSGAIGGDSTRFDLYPALPA